MTRGIQGSTPEEVSVTAEGRYRGGHSTGFLSASSVQKIKL